MRYRDLTLALLLCLSLSARAAPLTEAERQTALKAQLSQQTQWFEAGRHAEHLALWRAAVRLELDGERVDEVTLPAHADWVTDARNGAFRLIEHHGSQSVFAFRPDGRTMVTDGPTESATLWDVQSGWRIRELQGRTAKYGREDVVSVVYAPDGETLATVTEDAHVRLWDGRSGRLLHVIPADAYAVPAVAFSPDGQTLAIASAHRLVRFFSVVEGRPVGALDEYASEIESTSDDVQRWMLFTPDGTRLVTAASNRPVQVWNVGSGRLERLIGEATAQTTAVALSPSGSHIATAARDGTVHVWDAETGRSVRPPISGEGYATDLQFSPDGSLLALLYSFGLVAIERPSGGRAHSVAGYDRPPDRESIRLFRHMDFSPDGQSLVLAADYSREVVLWDVKRRRVRQTLSAPSDEVVGVAFSPDGAQVAAAMEYGKVALWDLRYAQMSPEEFVSATGHITDYRVCRETMSAVQLVPPPPPGSVWVEDVPGVDPARYGCDVVDDGLRRLIEPLTADADADVDAGLPTRIVDALVRSNKTIKRCWMDEKARSGVLPRRVDVRFTVEPSGRVSSATSATEQYKGTDFESCLARAFRRITFPAFDGGPVSMTYNFAL